MEGPRHTFFTASVVLWCSAASAVVAQASTDVDYLAIGDLVLARGVTEPYLTKYPQLGGRVVRGEESWLARGFDALYSHRRELPLVDEEGSGWFTPDEFESVLAELAPELAGKTVLVGGGEWLRVPTGLSARARILLGELRSSLPGQVQIEIGLSRGEATLLGRTISVAAGQRTWVSVVVEGSAVADYEVELAQSSFTGNPVPLAADSGAMVVVRPTLADGVPQGFVEVLVRLVEPGADAVFDSGRTSCGDIDRAHQVVHEFAAVVPIQLGVAGVHRWSGPGGEPVELTLTPTWQVPSRAPVAGRDVQYEPCWPTSRGFRCTGAVWPQPECDEPSLPVHDFVEELERVGAPGRPVGPFLADRFGIDEQAVALRGASRSRLQRMESVTVQLELFEAPVGAKPDAQGRMADARLVTRTELATARDTWACVTAHDELTVVLDWDLEVAQSSRIADPKPQRLAYGWFLDLKCSDTQIEIVGELSQRLALDARPTRLSVPMIAADAADPTTTAPKGNGDSALGLPGETVRIDVPRIGRQPISAVLPLRRTEPVVWRARSGALAPGREWVLVVRRLDPAPRQKGQ